MMRHVPSFLGTTPSESIVDFELEALEKDRQCDHEILL